MKFCHTLDEQRQLSPVEWGPFFLNYKLLKVNLVAGILLYMLLFFVFGNMFGRSGRRDRLLTTGR